MLLYLPKITNADSMISHPNTLLCNTFVGFISLKYYTNLTETAKVRYAFGCDVGVTGRKLREQRAKVHPTDDSRDFCRQTEDILLMFYKDHLRLDRDNKTERV